MTAKNSGSGKNTPPAIEKPTATGDTDITIPTMNTMSADSVLGGPNGGPVLQDGEDEGSMPAAGPVPSASMASALTGGSRALDRPAIRSGTLDVMESHAPMKELQLSDIDKKLEELRRSDLQLEPAHDIMHFADHAAALAFNEEWVIINVHEKTDVGVEDPLPLRVNGTTVAVKRGVDTIVRRKYVELLMRMKPQNVTTRIDRSDPDNIKNYIEKRSSLLNPFSIVRDDNPRSRHWIKKVMSEV